MPYGLCCTAAGVFITKCGVQVHDYLCALCICECSTVKLVSVQPEGKVMNGTAAAPNAHSDVRSMSNLMGVQCMPNGFSQMHSAESYLTPTMLFLCTDVTPLTILERLNINTFCNAFNCLCGDSSSAI